MSKHVRNISDTFISREYNCIYARMTSTFSAGKKLMPKNIMSRNRCSKHRRAKKQPFHRLKIYRGRRNDGWSSTTDTNSRKK